MTQLAIVVPCYNEEDVLRDTHQALADLLTTMVDSGLIGADSHIYYVDDGSRDATWSIIESLSARDSRAIGIKLSRNCGHQNAVLAGLMTVEGDAIISIDADLQDDLSAIPKMVSAFREGHDVVYGVRRHRDSDSAFKRHSAGAFYTFMRVMGVEVVNQHADFRLLSRRVVEHLRDFKEVNLFLRGMIPLIGFRSIEVHYDRQQRTAGQSKYSLRRMLSLALDGITSSSVVPLRIIGLMGLGIFVTTSAMSAWALWLVLFTNKAIPGWASTVLPTYFLGGVQILCLGVIGEYLGKIYAEVKSRPRYIVERITP